MQDSPPSHGAKLYYRRRLRALRASLALGPGRTPIELQWTHHGPSSGSVHKQAVPKLGHEGEAQAVFCASSIGSSSPPSSIVTTAITISRCESDVLRDEDEEMEEEDVADAMLNSEDEGNNAMPPEVPASTSTPLQQPAASYSSAGMWGWIGSSLPGK